MTEEYDPQQLLEQIKSFLSDKGWRFAEFPGSRTLLLMSGGKHGIFPSLLQVHPEHRLVTFHSVVQDRVPAEKRLAMAEFIARANYGLLVGNFELDFSDGEIRYKVSVHLADAELTAEMLNSLLQINFNTVDRYLPGLKSLLWNDMTPEDAVALVESAK